MRCDVSYALGSGSGVGKMLYLRLGLGLWLGVHVAGFGAGFLQPHASNHASDLEFHLGISVRASVRGGGYFLPQQLPWN